MRQLKKGNEQSYLGEFALHSVRKSDIMFLWAYTREIVKENEEQADDSTG